MEIGLTYTSETVVSATNTALAIGSGDLPVLATPAMIALMEQAAKESVIDYLTDGQTTVGAHIQVSHERASPLHTRIYATARLDLIEGRKLTFHVKAQDAQGIIGQGIHVRYVVDRDTFMSKVLGTVSTT